MISIKKWLISRSRGIYNDGKKNKQKHWENLFKNFHRKIIHINAISAQWQWWDYAWEYTNKHGNTRIGEDLSYFKNRNYKFIELKKYET